MNKNKILKYLKQRRNFLIKDKNTNTFGLNVNTNSLNFQFCIFHDTEMVCKQKMSVLPINFTFPVSSKISDENILELVLIEFYLRAAETSKA
ncbi:hypothetical protein [Fusobacterium necrophorum]|uniref:Uncharacterized protein n=1 Tax=Fusobacterium necrophorum subsp. funduliforme Fnf 1007 TaxID=1161424 RepID=A0AAN3VW39_9FUSO|nr:hypothetical protein [Fusobacterium necrophorum]EJU17772.1 hypothetical protein HMPREF1127_2139 [Fusobacterium necrophorum subsp. funduliforme Fnf 1007]